MEKVGFFRASGMRDPVSLRIGAGTGPRTGTLGA